MLQEWELGEQLIATGAEVDYWYEPLSTEGLLGSGDCCSVYTATPKQGNRAAVALKCEDLWEPSQLAAHAEEFRIMKQCENHPHIVKLVAVYHDTRARQLQVAMELMHGGTLLETVMRHGRLEPSMASAVLGNIASALLHVHSLGFIHRDIKPESEYRNTPSYCI